jgi:hypothetical protein
MRTQRPVSKVLVLAAVGLVAGTAGGAYAAFSSTTGTTSQSFTAAASFGCSAGSQTVTADLDTYVEQQNPTTSYGSSTVLQVKSWKHGANSRNIRTLIRFALPSVPSGCTVTGATMTLSTSAGTTGRTLQAFRAAAAWTESTTWTTQPATTGTASTTSSVASGNVTFNVLTQAQAHYSGTNTGFLVRDSVEDGANVGQSFDSREATSNRPTLTVSWG